MPAVRFAPRRLGHINLYVSDLERSLTFYEGVCGLERVRMESAINAGFLSNGNTHHDVGLIEVSAGKDRIGRDGKVQIAATRGTRPGLNHLGWEMENEAELVAAYRRLDDLGLKPTALYDHIISRAVYVSDPDGNVHEFYADTLKDWRSVFNLEHDGLVTSHWDPLAGSPSESRNYTENPPLRRVADAEVHARYIAGAIVATRNYEAMRAFYGDVAGLQCLAEREGDRRETVFGGRLGHPDLKLVEVGPDVPAGLQRFCLLLEEGDDVEAAGGRLAAAGLEVRLQSDETRPALLLQDPDGFAVELFLPHPSQRLAA